MGQPDGGCGDAGGWFGGADVRLIDHHLGKRDLMSVLWDYFKNTLRFPLILKPGALAQMAKGGAGELDSARGDVLWLRDQFLPNKCDDDFINDFAESRGIRRWPDEPDDFFKDRVVRAYLFYMLGGKKAGVEEIFSLVGIEAEIVELRELRDAWIISGGVRLDGTWQVDGGEKLIAPFQVSGSYPLAWAEFLVRASLEDAVDPVWQSLARHIVAEFKPARSIPHWLYIVETSLDQGYEFEAAGQLTGTSKLSGFDCPLKLDGTWGLGRVIRVDGSWAVRSTPHPCTSVCLGQTHQDKIVNRLEGSWTLDGSKQLMCTLIPHITISLCRISTAGTITGTSEIMAGPSVGGDVIILPYPLAFYDGIFGGSAGALPSDTLDGGDAADLPEHTAFGGNA
jgi:hypothetical protein